MCIFISNPKLLAVHVYLEAYSHWLVYISIRFVMLHSEFAPRSRFLMFVSLFDLVCLGCFTSSSSRVARRMLLL